MSRTKKKDKPWVLIVDSVIPGLAHTLRKFYEHEATAQKQASHYNPQWFTTTIKRRHD